MKLEQSFHIDAPLDDVWAALVDLPQVAPCLPGAEITDRREDGSYAGTFTIRIGPVTAAFRGTVTLAEVDEAAHAATMQANGTDKRGQGGAKATIVSRVRADAGGTAVEVDTDYAITGRLATFGRPGLIEDVARRMMGEFAECLQQRLAAERAPEAAPGGAAAAAREAAPPAPAPPARPVRGIRLLLGVLGDRIRRLFRRRERNR
jgi:carbon monoxide dehydrogenase subunit G